MPASERATLYATRPCLFVTTRILVVDQLSGRISGDQIAGMLVLNAHRWVLGLLQAANWVLRLHGLSKPWRG